MYFGRGFLGSKYICLSCECPEHKRYYESNVIIGQHTLVWGLLYAP